MKLVTWNINSAKAREKRLVEWLERSNPDVMCLQELKLVDDAFPREPIEKLGYHCSLFGQKTYNGVAILSKSEPKDVHRGLEDDVEDPQSRLISANIDGVHVLSAYFPNGGDMGSDKYEYKLEWMERLRAYLDRRFDSNEDEVLLCGDFNVAPFPDDCSLVDFEGTVLANPDVRAALDHIQDFGFVDVFRPFHPSGGVYTWWDYRAMGFERNHGLRIDHVWCTPQLAKTAIGAIVDRSEREGKGASDHAPVMVELDRPA